MKLSCGILILNEVNEILTGHVTGNNFFDIPKGLKDNNESNIDCAIRECKEETSLVFSIESLIDLGEYKYNKEKNLHLFLTNISKNNINLQELVCTSYFEHFYSKKIIPEVDYFEWVSIFKLQDKCSKSMGKLLTNIFVNDNIINNISLTHKLKK